MFDDTFYYNSMFWSFIFKRMLDEKFYEQKKIEEKKVIVWNVLFYFYHIETPCEENFWKK